ncbi:MAG TPA: response regulator [Candidatus Heimdallarchaeota archaeon]|nr:response regulator [Candidatus Heimdallarchaeota archaeon]
MEKIKVLCIDDEPEQRKALCSLLRSKDYSVTTAASSQSGLNLFKKRNFDAVLCDLNMPKMDGLEFREKVKRINPDIPVIILTSHGTIPAAVKSLKKGAFDFILEPPKIEEIEATIGKAIETTHLQKQLRESNQNLEILVKNLQTELKETNRHLKEAQTQLVQSEKMASLGQLVAGIAHEINTPIGAVNSMHDTLFRTLKRMKEFIQQELPEDCKQIPKLEAAFKLIDDSNSVIKSGAERVINIVTHLKNFARLDEAELKTVDIHEGIEDTLVLIHHELKHNITLVKNYGDVPPISCFPSQLNQVFLNLLVNSKQAIKDKGTITITTYVKNKKVHIKFSDNGVGIPKGSVSRIFDPGYTTKGIGVGTGLGLSISYNIIQNHRGEIKVNSELGKGTEFLIALPMDLEAQLEREKTKN